MTETEQEPTQAEQEMNEEMTEEYIKSLMGATPMGEEKQNVHTFLHNVAVAPDTTKIGNLTSEEIGTPVLPQRTLKELALFCKDVANMGYFHDYLNAKSEILTSTSLSKEAKLINLAVVQRKEFAEGQKKRVVNKGWFKGGKKEEVVE